MRFQSKRELLAQVGARYREADHAQKSVMLSEFIAATGYNRKYAIRLLSGPIVLPVPLKRLRSPAYGPAVQEALAVAWAAANYICAKRLVPFLPELLPTLERHGHLQLTDAVRGQLLAISPATADRLLQPLRQKTSPRGLGTTRAGRLLKHQIPIRTFADWNETRPGFLEADLVAHCGWSIEGAFLHTLVLTDVASGWTECLALLHRSQAAVVQALDHAQLLLPIPMLGLDTDNGSEFINAELLAYCEREHLTFTRGRAYRKNDQCYVEQKNGAIVRQFVGYDRFESERAYRQLAELYRAVRLYVNFFQPSMKLLTKQRDQGKVHRKYDQARTPLQRLLATDVLMAEARARLETIYRSLDPLALLKQITILQDALWQLAVLEPAAATPAETASSPTDVRFQVAACRLPGSIANQSGAPEIAAGSSAAEPTEQRRKRKYHRTQKPRTPHWWRTRADPFGVVWEELRQWLAAHPERTAKAALLELQARYPGQFPDTQLRTLQRRVQAWRAQVILTFDDQWLQEEIQAGQTFPRPLQAVDEAELSKPCPVSISDSAMPQAAVHG